MSETQVLPFKPGERIALPSLPVIRIEGAVAILKKTRLTVEDGCGARHQIRIETPFFVRGGFRVNRVVKYRVPSWAFTVHYETPWGAYGEEKVPDRAVYLDELPDLRVLAEKLIREKLGEQRIARVIDVKINEQITQTDVYVRKFKHAEVMIPPNDYFKYIRRLDNDGGDTYFVYEFINENEAKLVDDDSRIDYVLHIFGHRAESRAGCATIKLLAGDIVWSNVKHTCCRIASTAVAMVVARYGGRITVAMNNLPYRGCCEEWVVEVWESSFPSPRLISRYNTTDPVSTELRPEDVV